MKILSSSLMEFRDYKSALPAILITLCATAFLAAEPADKATPEAQAATVSHPDLKAFPPAKAGMERFVIVLPHKERGEDDAFRVELIPGKIMETDGVNLVRLGSTLVEKTLEGWAYSFYEVNDAPAMTTLIGVDPKAPKVKQFVSGVSLHTNYNSRLPIVIYAPAGYEIRYRIWKADEAVNTAPKG